MKLGRFSRHPNSPSGIFYDGPIGDSTFHGEIGVLYPEAEKLWDVIEAAPRLMAQRDALAEAAAKSVRLIRAAANDYADAWEAETPLREALKATGIEGKLVEVPTTVPRWRGKRLIRCATCWRGASIVAGPDGGREVECKMHGRLPAADVVWLEPDHDKAERDGKECADCWAGVRATTREDFAVLGPLLRDERRLKALLENASDARDLGAFARAEVAMLCALWRWCADEALHHRGCGEWAWGWWDKLAPRIIWGPQESSLGTA